MAISTTIKTIQDIMRKDAGVDGDAQRISQLVWMIFLKIFEDKEKEYEQLEDNYRSPIPEKLRWRNWAADPEGITGEELLDFVNNELFKSLKNLHAQSDRRGLVVREVFEDAYNYMKSGTLMRQVINRINEIDFNISEDRHLFGDIYEQILRDLQSAGNAGEYYTPRAITQFMVDMVDPKLGEKILDPACGTGGFLTCAINNIRRDYVKSIEDEEKLQKSISGVEKKPLPHLLCVTNMLLHGIEVPSQIRHDNTLARPLRDYGSADRVDVIVTNPPFGGMEEDGIESNFPANYRTRETADLFLLLITHLLKEGGRCAIVLPDNSLFGEGSKTRIKEKLLEECNLHTIVRLPNGVFSPYAGIKTNLLFFTKGEPTREIWYYEHPYPPSYKSYSKTKPICIEEFEREKVWWSKREQNEYAWKVSLEQIKSSGYNLDIKNPHINDKDRCNPEEMLYEYRNLLSELTETQYSLKSDLKPILRGEDNNIMIKTFFDNFEMLVNAPNGVKKLRELIMQLAVNGKIVPQNQHDETASVLFEKIKAQKERLVIEKTIKIIKPLSPLKENDIPYKLPSTWMWVRLGEVVDYNIATKVSPSDIPEDAWLLELEDIEKDSSKIRQTITFKERKSKSTKTKFKKGDVLYGKLRPYLNKVVVAESDGFCTTEILPLRGYYGISPKYLMYALKRPDFLSYVNSKTYGVKMPRLGTEDGRNAPFPLPPYEEQKRIVAKVDRLITLCDELEVALLRSHADNERLMEAVVGKMLAG